MRKYSKGFERDYEFYLKNVDNFDFCGTSMPRYQPSTDSKGLSAKECFHKIESGVKIGYETKDKFQNKITVIPCNEPDLLSRIMLCKAGINFQIKQWVEGRVDGTLPLAEFSKRLAKVSYPDGDFSEIRTLAWVNQEPVYYEDIETQYGLPEWVVRAVDMQYFKTISKKAA